ncbi:MAG: anthranilate synthase component I family protein [Planctomycetota bacterium]|nr:anthranilate synthase component I family protein [Planctomycetota bacterium]
MPIVSPAQIDPPAAETCPAMALVPPSGAFAGCLAGRTTSGLGHLPAIATVMLGEDGSTAWTGADRPEVLNPGVPERHPPLRALGSVFAGNGFSIAGNAWMGWLAYDLAASIEPGVLETHAAPSMPLAMLHRVDLARASAAPPGPQPMPSVRPVLRSDPGRAGYTRAVARALEYIRAGDIYQANIAHQLSGRCSGSAADLFATLAATANPAHGLGLLAPAAPPGNPHPHAHPHALAVLSLSPELFLSFDAPTRRLTTRPMKGTRPGNADPRELRDAEKDRAELAMIVDLMRNDLGRVCEFGSVRVDDPRRIERHATGPGAVLQATATVSGTVREGLTTADILEATFPPGSVTGTPKLRAMQIIDELEPFARGPWCGCLGVFHDNGSFELAVAIRTIVIKGQVQPGTDTFVNAELTYAVGAGIVADSDPESEWLETLDKARVLETVFDIRAE